MPNSTSRTISSSAHGNIYVPTDTMHSASRQRQQAWRQSRISKFSPGVRHNEFGTPHALAFNARGRLRVADRGNHRIDQDGSGRNLP
jgi:hypothetical protein